MLQKLADHIQACLERAALAQERAESGYEPGGQGRFRRDRQAWRHLATSYQFAESLERFILDVEPAKKTPPEPPGPK